MKLNIAQTSKSILRPLALVAVFLLTSGCAQLHDNLMSIYSADYLIEQQEYRLALEQLQKQTPLPKKQIRSLKKTIQKYESKQLAVITRAIRQQDWFTAENGLQNLRQRVPESKKMKQAQRSLTLKQEAINRKLKVDAALAKAQVIISDWKQIEFDLKRNPDGVFLNSEKSSLQEQRVTQAQLLLELSKTSLKAKDYGRADRCYRMAKKLNPKVSTEKQYRAMFAGLNKKNKQTTKRKQAQLLEQLEAALESENYDKVKEVSELLQSPNYQNTKVENALAVAQAQVFRTADDLDRRGDNVYRQGRIQEAVMLWQQALELTPEKDGLKDKLRRAEKVQNKLDRLRNKQQQGPK